MDRSDPIPRLSIVVGTRNRPAALAECVASLIEHTRCDFELLIGDASDAPIRAFEDPRVRVLREPEPLGFVRGYNRLFRQARGELVCFLNDDLVVLPEWDERALAVFERAPRVALVCLPLVEPDEPDPFVLLYRKIPYANMAIVRREVGDALGWFDERFSFYGADPDFTMRLLAAGHAHAPVLGRVIAHRKLSDLQRQANEAERVESDAQLLSLWKPRRRMLRRRYRRHSFRYFAELPVRRVPSHDALGLDASRPDEPRVRPLRPRPPLRLRAWGWWLPFLG